MPTDRRLTQTLVFMFKVPAVRSVWMLTPPRAAHVLVPHIMRHRDPFNNQGEHGYQDR